MIEPKPAIRSDPALSPGRRAPAAVPRLSTTARRVSTTGLEIAFRGETPRLQQQPTGLNEREVAVARLVAEGLPNR